MDAQDFRERRQQAGLTQQDVADALGCARMSIARYETGERPIPAAVAGYIMAQPVTSEAPEPVAFAPPVTSEPVTSGSPVTWDQAALERELGRRLTPWTVPAGLIKRDFKAMPLRPGWQACGHRVVHAAIPDPIPFNPPAWARPDSILTRSGRVFDYTTGQEQRRHV